MKKRKKNIKLFLKNGFYTIMLTTLLLPTYSYSAATTFNGPLNSSLNSVAEFTEALLKAAVYVLFPVAVLFLVYSGFLFISAQGNSEKLKEAKRNFMWTIVGISLLLGAWALSLVIKGTIEPILR